MTPPDAPTVILADGDFPTHPRPLAILRAAGRIVCCDGAAVSLLAAAGRLPDHVVGDLDSLPAGFRDRFPDRVVHIPGQDDNDLAKAFAFCLGKGWTAPAILGATGHREDHALGNIGHLFDFAERDPAVTMATDRGLFTPVAPAAGKTARRFSSHAGEAVSLFADSPQTRVTVRGLHWPLDAASLPRWWSGTLNVSEGDAFDVEAEHGVVLVYQAYA